MYSPVKVNYAAGRSGRLKPQLQRPRLIKKDSLSSSVVSEGEELLGRVSGIHSKAQMRTNTASFLEQEPGRCEDQGRYRKLLQKYKELHCKNRRMEEFFQLKVIELLEKLEESKGTRDCVEKAVQTEDTVEDKLECILREIKSLKGVLSNKSW